MARDKAEKKEPAHISDRKRIKTLEKELAEARERLAKCNSFHKPDCDYMGCCGGSEDT